MKNSLIHFAALMVVGVLTLGITAMGRSQPRLQTDFRHGIDSLRLRGMPRQMLDEMRQRTAHQAIPSPLRKVVSPQSQICVIDTAIVRRLGEHGGLGSYIPGDTTRHLYSFDANAKRTSDLTQKLIGDLWVDSLLRANTYDASNNMLSDLYEYWSDGQWMNVKRYTYTYDANRNRLSELYETWDGQWVNAWRYARTFDANGHQLSELYEAWSNGQWVKSHRQTWTYDVHGTVLTWLNEGWSNGQLVDSSSWRYTYTYDANGNALTELDEYWSNGQWVNYSRSTYTYDANNNLLHDLSEYWDGQWQLDGASTYAYDANNNILSAFHWYEYRGWAVGWCAEDAHIYTYDASNNMLTDWHGKGNGPLDLWPNTFYSRDRHTYTYDANNNLLHDLSEYWGGQWGESSRWTYSYDANGNLISAWFDGVSVSVNNIFSLTDRAENDYSYYGYEFTLTRNLIVTGVASQAGDVPATFSLSQNYPNPFNPSTTIKYELPKSSEVRLSVFDMLGREVSLLVNERRNAGVHEVKFDGANLASGVYLYRLQAGDFVQAKKLLILR